MIKKISVAFLFLIIILLVISIFSLPKNYAIVTIINDSNKTLYDINISLSRYKSYFYIPKLLPNSSKTITFKNFSDTHYIISFRANKSIYKEIGYLTNGMNFNDLILLTPLEVNLLQESY